MELSMKPLVDSNIFVVNEAYSLLQRWAEGAIKAADEILETYFEIPRPWNFTSHDFNQVVAQTSSSECAAETSSGGDTGGGVGGEEATLLSGSLAMLVSMADGTTKRLVYVEAGEMVLTGTGVGYGLVTEKLVHHVDRVVPIATPQGTRQIG